MIDGTKVFAEELALIQNSDIKEFTTKCIRGTPQYFYHVAASSTGKYHPAYSLGEGGLIRHTKAVVMFAQQLLGLEHNKAKFTADERDVIIAACILHDSFKHGTAYSQYTVADHSVVAADYIINTATENSDFIMKIAEGVRSHMGEWNTDRSGKVIMPKPTTEIQKFVHECDYLASRKNIIVQFANPYNPAEYEENPCKPLIDEIIDICKYKIINGESREKLYDLIACYNNGEKNPLRITSEEVANNILKELKANG